MPMPMPYYTNANTTPMPMSMPMTIDAMRCDAMQVADEEQQLGLPAHRREISPTEILATTMGEAEVEDLATGLSVVAQRIRKCGAGQSGAVGVGASAEEQARAFWEQMQSSGSLDTEDVAEVQSLAESIGRNPIERTRGVPLL